MNISCPRRHDGYVSPFHGSPGSASISSSETSCSALSIFHERPVASNGEIRLHDKLGQFPAGRHARYDQHRTERHHQDFLCRCCDLSAADSDRLDLRHEPRVHAVAGMALRLPAGNRADGCVGDLALLVFQAPRLAIRLACAPSSSLRLSLRRAPSPHH